MTPAPTGARSGRVLKRSDMHLADLGAAAATAARFVRQGRTSHFTTSYSSGLLNHPPGSVILLTSDGSWRSTWSILAPGNFSGRPFSDLLFYDAAAGVGEFYSTEGGNMDLLGNISGWRESWSMIIPCNLTNGATQDLLFYDPGAGEAEIYSTDGHGGISLIKSHSGWRESWSVILPCKLTSGNAADLLFYDPGAGEGEMYSTDGHGEISLIKNHSGWRESWSIVKPCKVSDGRLTDIMFYDPEAGVGEFYSTDGHGEISLLQSDDTWRHSWSTISPANFTDGAGEDLVFYDPGAGTGEIYTTRGNTLATAVLATCEGDYTALRGYFGVSSDDLPFNVFVQSGNSGASHGSCDDSDLYCDAFSGTDPDLVRMLVVAEADEVMMADQDRGWDCGASNGEGLSRVLSIHRYPNEFGMFATGPSWLRGGRPDFVTFSDGTDQNSLATGCATLFLHYLKFQLGYSFEQITRAGCLSGDLILPPALQHTYARLTGQPQGLPGLGNGHQAFPAFKSLLDRRFAAGESAPLITDNPFPIFRDLLFYDPRARTGELYTSDTDGEIAHLSTDTGWRDSWSLILPGSFSGGHFDDLLFYDSAAGTGEFYTSDGHGGIHLLGSENGWRSSWDTIIPARFAGERFDGLLFYERAAGTGEIYKTDGHGRTALLASHTDWRTSWTAILAGSFTRNRYPDLLFYDAAAGLVEIYSTDAHGNVSLVGSTTNLPHDWTLALTCNVTGGQFVDVMFYGPTKGQVQLFTTDGEGRLLALSTQRVGSTWSEIHATGFTEFLFYDAGAGLGEYRRTDLLGAMTPLKQYNDWRRSWSLIAPGNYS
jgi:hypothetical protein